MTNIKLAEQLLAHPEMQVIARFDYPGATTWYTETCDEFEVTEKDGKLVIDLIQ